MRAKTIFKILFISFTVISLAVVMKYSNTPLITPIEKLFNLVENSNEGNVNFLIHKLYEFNKLFIKPSNTDGIALNFSVGYIVSALFYLIVVYIPEKLRRKKIQKYVMANLEGACADVLLMLVNIYKNVSTKEEWEFQNLEDDKEFFNKKYFDKMKVFDGYSVADTCYRRQVDDEFEEITWDDKLDKTLRDSINILKDILSCYILLLDEDIINGVIEFINDDFIVAYLGLTCHKSVDIVTGKNGIKYAERCSCYGVRNDPTGKKTPIFKGNNIKKLKQFITTFLKLRDICIKKGTLDKKFAFKYFVEEECGQYAIAIAE